MKKLIAGILALSMITVSLTGCGNSSETSEEDAYFCYHDRSRNKNDEETEPVLDTNSKIEENETEEPASEITGSTNEKGIIPVEKPSVYVADPGNYETYLEGLTMPECIMVDVLMDESSMSFASVGDRGLFDINIHLTEEESDEAKEMQYTMYTDKEYLYAVSAEDGKAVYQKAKGTEKDVESASDTSETFYSKDSDLKFKEYAGEETIDGIVYDVILCEMEAEDTEVDVDAKMYFTKDGGFSRMAFSKDQAEVSIYEIQDIVIPDYAWEESKPEDITTKLFSLMMGLLFSAMSDAMEESPILETQEEITDAQDA